MATYTTNYNLKKPSSSDTVDVADINGNMDTIDSTMKTLSDGLGGKISSVKVNGSALAPDSSHAVDVTVPTALSSLSDDSTHRVVSDTEKSTWNAKQSQHGTATASLAVANWSSDSQTVSVTGVTASNTVIVSPAPASLEEYGECGVYCSAQGSGTLTFVCASVPENALTVNVVILG